MQGDQALNTVWFWVLVLQATTKLALISRVGATALLAWRDAALGLNSGLTFWGLVGLRVQQGGMRSLILRGLLGFYD